MIKISFGEAKKNFWKNKEKLYKINKLVCMSNIGFIGKEESTTNFFMLKNALDLLFKQIFELY